MFTAEQALHTAFQYYRAGQFAPAQCLFRYLVELQPRRAEGHFFLGAIALRDGHRSQALAYFRKAAELDGAFQTIVARMTAGGSNLSLADWTSFEDKILAAVNERRRAPDAEYRPGALREDAGPRTRAQPSCYCITGCSRSGTSMIASLLQKGGLDIGSRLVEASESNIRGHFEDSDFQQLHIAVLGALGLDTDGYVVEPGVRVGGSFLARARALIQARREAGHAWGWKDPRTTLFLDFWAELLPEACFLLLFRAPWEVADSLFRRGDAVLRRDPGLAVQMWLNYNRALLDFHGRFPGRCLLIESRAAAAVPEHLMEAIATKFGDHFTPDADVFEPELFRHDSATHARRIVRRLFPEALELYEELRCRAILVTPPSQPADVPDSAAEAEWALKYWADFRTVQTIAKRLEGSLEDAREEIARLEESLEKEGARWDAELRHARANMGLLQRQIAWMHSSANAHGLTAASA